MRGEEEGDSDFEETEDADDGEVEGVIVLFDFEAVDEIDGGLEQGTDAHDL